MATVRVLVVDDNAQFRRLVCSSLRTIPLFADYWRGIRIRKARELRPDLILLDIGLPKLNGIEAGHQISRIIPVAS
jgi:CheY-like chemotaxis protein